MGGLETGRLTDEAASQTKNARKAVSLRAPERLTENENARELVAGERWMQIELWPN